MMMMRQNFGIRPFYERCQNKNANDIPKKVVANDRIGEMQSRSSGFVRMN
jgi:hypothetical protein